MNSSVCIWHEASLDFYFDGLSIVNSSVCVWYDKSNGKMLVKWLKSRCCSCMSSFSATADDEVTASVTRFSVCVVAFISAPGSQFETDSHLLRSLIMRLWKSLVARRLKVGRVRWRSGGWWLAWRCSCGFLSVTLMSFSNRGSGPSFRMASWRNINTWALWDSHTHTRARDPIIQYRYRHWYWSVISQTRPIQIPYCAYTILCYC